MKNILLVDDNKYLVEALQLALNASFTGYDILTAKNGREALDILGRKPVALILTDLEMPVMSGYEFIELKNRLHSSIPLLAMTGNLSPEVSWKLSSLGVVRCIEKPFDLDEVTRLIKENLASGPLVARGTENAARYASSNA